MADIKEPVVIFEGDTTIIMNCAFVAISSTETRVRLEGQAVRKALLLGLLEMSPKMIMEAVGEENITALQRKIAKFNANLFAD